jgi:hypothetical protein
MVLSVAKNEKFRMEKEKKANLTAGDYANWWQNFGRGRFNSDLYLKISKLRANEVH